MLYANVILLKGDPAMENEAVENMVSMAVMEVGNPEQFVRRLQGYQEEISQLAGSGQDKKEAAAEDKKDYFECLKTRITKSALWVNAQAKKGDVRRNRVNYGSVAALAQVIQDFGHKINIAVWEDDNSCLRIPLIEIDGEKTVLEG